MIPANDHISTTSTGQELSSSAAAKGTETTQASNPALTTAESTAPSFETSVESSFVGGTRTNHRILLVAYACGPGRGSEESVGWDTAEALAEQGFQVTILTRTSERNTCPPPSDRHPNLDIVCHDIPGTWRARFAGLGKPGVELGYLMWLLSAKKVVSSLHNQSPFTSAQHVTYARYWMPSPLRVLDIPWILGPVGGGESIPSGLRSSLSVSGRAFELVRDAMRWAGERSSAVQEAARQCALALANTQETAARLQHLGARQIEIMNSAALADAEFAALSTRPSSGSESGRRGFVSIGRLLDWKGFHLGLEAFAQAGLEHETYTIIGTGPFEVRLREMARELGVDNRVRFTGAISRSEVFIALASARALVHPSLHESGGFVCLEAMAAGTPVICVDTGGPGLFVTENTGFAVLASSHASTVSAMANAMMQIVQRNPESMGSAARAHVGQNHTMRAKSKRLAAIHSELAERLVAPSSWHPSNSTSHLSPTHLDTRAEPEDSAIPVSGVPTGSTTTPNGDRLPSTRTSRSPVSNPGAVAR